MDHKVRFEASWWLCCFRRAVMSHETRWWVECDKHHFIYVSYVHIVMWMSLTALSLHNTHTHTHTQTHTYMTRTCTPFSHWKHMCGFWGWQGYTCCTYRVCQHSGWFPCRRMMLRSGHPQGSVFWQRLSAYLSRVVFCIASLKQPDEKALIV